MRRGMRPQPGVLPSPRLSCLRCRGVFRGSTGRCPIDGARLHAGDRDPLIGTWFAELYLVEALLGESELGRVYRARRLLESQPLALRVLSGDQAADSSARTRFRRQAESATRLDHPNVVGVGEVGHSREGLPFAVTAFVDGAPLSALLAREGPMTGERALSIARQVASGLVHAHRRGVSHRDLRAGNVLIQRARRGDLGRVTDFAIGAPVSGRPRSAAATELDARRDLASLAGLLREMVGPTGGAGVGGLLARLEAELGVVLGGGGGPRARRRTTASPPL